MKSAALGIGYLIWCRHKRGFIASAAGLAAMTIVYPVLFAYTRVVSAVVVSTIPLIAIFGFVLNACLFTEEPGSMVSSYPKSLFALPVRTGALVFWPMFSGSAIAALLWIVTAGVIYPLSGFRPPVWIPALALAALVGWFQGMAWMPLAARWLRSAVVIVTTLALSALPIWLIQTDRGASVVLGSLLSACLGASFLLGLASVATDRHGGSWRLTPARFRFSPRPTVGAVRSIRPPFESTAAAQLWYERNCHGLVLPLYLGTVLCLIWGVLLFSQRGPFPPLHLALIVSLLAAIPVVLAGAIGPAVGRFRPLWAGNHGFGIFIAVRPITSWQLVAAKLRMAVASVVKMVAFALVGTILWIAGSDNVSSATTLGRDLAVRYPGGRGLAILALAVVLLPALVARQFTSGFANTLTDRRWIADAAAWIYAVGLLVLCSAGAWLASHPEALPRLYAIIPWFVVGVAMVKGTIAIAVFRLVLRRRLIDRPAISCILGVWLAITGLAIGLVILVSPPDGMPVPLPVLLLGIATFVPLLRFPLATLALEWNRHR
jgi:hypothetical protein